MGGWPDGYGTGRRRREGEGGAREKDIKVRNSQRGERAPPRHRLDRGSLIPFLECSPLPPPPPSTTHPPPVSSATLPPLTQGSSRPPISTHSVELESPRVRALHTHSRAYVSSCPAAGTATASATVARMEKERESVGFREKKRRRLYGTEGDRSHLSIS